MEALEGFARGIPEFRPGELAGPGRRRARNRCSGRGKNESAVFFFDSALRNLHPVLDEAAYASTRSSTAELSLVSLGRLDAAKSTYAKGLVFARRLNLKVGLFIIRYGLATIDLLRNQPSRALAVFERIGEDARREGFSSRVLSADLRIAECLGRLGRTEEMTTRLRELRNSELIETASLIRVFGSSSLRWIRKLSQPIFSPMSPGSSRRATAVSGLPTSRSVSTRTVAERSSENVHRLGGRVP